MSKALLDALETRVNTAVETISGLRSEVRDLKDERRLLEEKLRELLTRIETVESGGNGMHGEIAPVRTLEQPVRMAGTHTYGSPSSEY